MRFYKILATALCVASISLFSCGGDDPKPSPDPNVPGPVDPDDPKPGIEEPLTPTESKEFLSTTAESFINTFRTADQSEAIRFCNDAINEYGDLDMPSEFEIDSEESGSKSFAPGLFFRDLLHGLNSANPARINSAAMVYTYNINFPRFSGVYKPGRYKWIKKSESKDIVFEFTLNGENCVIRAQAENGTSDLTVEVEGEDWYCDLYTGEYDYEEYTDRFDISIPRTVKLSVTKGKSQLLTSTINTNVNTKGHVLAWDVYTKVANIEVTSKGNGVDSNIIENTSLVVGGKTLISTKSQLNGQNLCNYDKIKSFLDGEEDDVLFFIADGVSEVDIMGQVQLRGKVTFDKDLLDALDSDWDSYEYNNQSKAEADCEKAVEKVNKNVIANVSYKGTSTVQAQVRFQKDFYSYSYYYWEYSIMPVLYFPADKSTYTFEEYTEKGFASVEDLWDAQIDNYKRLWK